MSTINQINFVRSLAAQRVCTPTIITGVEAVETMTTREASSLIDALKAAPRLQQAPREAAEVPEGMHKVGDTIYKVQRAIHGSGGLYAKRLVQYGDEWAFEYARGAMRLLSAATRMSLEEARAFGALYGTCCVCARLLTNEQSILEGIGPVCKSKM